MPLTTVSLAKTTQPTLTAVLNRERLFAALDAQAGAAAVWITGPPGAGKTTLMASYLGARRRKVLWYQMDRADGDIATFLYYLRQTALKHSRTGRVEVPELPSGGADWRTIGRRIFRAIFARFGEPITIVFDNIESVPGTSELPDLLADALAEVPRHSQVVIAGHADPPAAFARSRVSGALGSIGPEALRVSDEECRAVAQLRGAAVSAETLRYIEALTEGWMTGTILLLEYARRVPDLPRRGLGRAAAAVYDYIAHEVFAQFDTEVRSFMLMACWPTRLSVKLAAALTLNPAADQILANLARNNYFVTERDDSLEREYTFHPMLRNFLQSLARRELGARRIGELQRRSAELLLGTGQPEEAAALLAECLDWDGLERAILEHAEILLAQGRHSMLAEWLDDLPHDRLNANPWLLYWSAAARLPHAPREARRHFERAHGGFLSGTAAEPSGRASACCGVVESVLAEADDFGLLDTWIVALESIVTESPRLLDGALASRIATAMVTALLARDPASGSYDAWLARLIDSVRGRGATPTPAGVRALALARLLWGNLDMDAAPGVFPAESGADGLVAMLGNLLRGDWGAAIDAADRAYTEAIEIGRVDRAALARIGRVAIELGQGAGASARALLAEIPAGSLSQSRFTRSVYHYVSSWLALLEEDAVAAYQEQRQALACASELGMPILEVLSRTALAQLALRCQDTRAGVAHLRRVHALARDLRNPLLEYLTLLVYAEMALQSGRSASGVNALRYALGLGRAHGYYHVPWWQPRKLADLCVLALRHDIEADYVRALIARRELQPTRPPVDLEAWPWKIRIRSLGSFSVVCDGTPAAEADSGSSRPMQLLRILTACGGREVPAADVAAAIWPRIDSEYAGRSLTMNLHRLRRALGDQAVLLRDGRLSINPDAAWVDVWALERLLARIEDASPTALGAELGVLLDELLRQYAGPLFAGDDHPTIVQARERLRADFVKAVVRLAEAGARDAHAQMGIEIYERAIRADPGAEALYRRLMLAHAGRGNPAAVLDVFERCRTVLASLRSAPSPESELIRDSARATLAGVAAAAARPP